MGGFSGQVWVLLAVTAGVGVLSILHFLACSVRNSSYMHDMRVRVASLRKEQMERLHELARAAEEAERESIKMSEAAAKARKAA